MAYKIEKNVPMPPRKLGGNSNSGWKRASRFPIVEMEVGDYFFLENIDERSSASSYAHIVSRRTGRKFETRKYKDGYGIWRTA